MCTSKITSNQNVELANLRGRVQQLEALLGEIDKLVDKK